MMHRFLLVIISSLAFTAGAGRFHFGEIRYFPKAYSEPEIETKPNGKKTYKPAIPTEFKEYHLGIGGETSRVGVRGQVGTRNSRPSVKLRLKASGHMIRVYQGEVFQVGDKRYRLLGIWPGGIKYQDIQTGNIRRKRR